MNAAFIKETLLVFLPTFRLYNATCFSDLMYMGIVY